MLKPESITKNALISGIEPGQIVRIFSSDPMGTDALSIVYKTNDGRLGERVLFRTDEASLSLAEAGRPWAFDAPGADFKLVGPLNLNLRRYWEMIMKFNFGSLFNPFGNDEPSPELLKWLKDREEWRAGSDERHKRWQEAREKGICIDFARRSFDPALLPEPLRSEAIKYLRKHEG